MTQMYLIGDELTVIGFGLAGLKKAHVATPETVSQVLNKVKDSADIIIITNALYEKISREQINKLRSAGKMIIKIPDRTGGGEDVISELVKSTIGFEIRSKSGEGR